MFYVTSINEKLLGLWNWWNCFFFLHQKRFPSKIFRGSAPNPAGGGGGSTLPSPPPAKHLHSRLATSLKLNFVDQKLLGLCGLYSESHPFYAKLWTVADQKPMVKKIWKKYEKSWDGLPSSPKIKKRTKTLRDPTIITFPHFLRTLGGVSTSNVPSYEWSSWQLRTRRAASVRMFDHKRERCTVCSQCAPLPSTSHPFSLMKKGSFGRFQPLSFDFISRNNGSWAF